MNVAAGPEAPASPNAPASHTAAPTTAAPTTAAPTTAAPPTAAPTNMGTQTSSSGGSSGGTSATAGSDPAESAVGGSRARRRACRADSEATSAGLRSGPELVRASQDFATEDLGRTWSLTLQTLAVTATAWAGALLAPQALAAADVPAWTLWPVWGAFGVLLGLLGVRWFIFYHDYCHGALFRSSKLGGALMTVVGWYTLAVPSVWKETHNYHHRNNAKLTGSAIGSYPTVSLGTYKALEPSQRRQLKAIRHPLSMTFGLFTTFMLGMCVAPFRRNRATHAMAPVALLVWWVVFGVMAAALSVGGALLLWVLPTAVHSALGSYLFYAQHNFPGAELRGRREWEFTHAALKCSSYFEMSPLMHWFTGNIGFHHVHHLNHRIPFYRLPEAMAAMPELQDPGRTSWRYADVVACLNCAVWDPERNRLISFAEADAALAETAALAAK